MGNDGSDRDLGTLGSWILDGTLAGGLLPAVACGLIFGWTWATEPGGPPVRVVVAVFVLAAAIGGALGSVLAPVLRWGARRSWRVTPALAFGLGPAAGALCTVILVFAILFAMGEPPAFDPSDLVVLLGFGGVAIGPPWVAYLAVRAARRRGTAVAIASTVWMVAPVAILIVAEEVSRW